MKKKILFIFAMVAFMLISVPNVYASTTITQDDFDSAKAGTPSNGVSYTEASGHKWYSLTAGEEFVLGGDVNLDDAFLDSNNNTLNLNGHGITNAEVLGEDMLLNAYDRDLTLTGTGTVGRNVIVGGGTLTLDGNITYNGTVTISDGTDAGTAVVNAGTFNGGFESANSTATINAGTFVGDGWGAALQLNNSTTTIKGGTFTAGGASSTYIEGGSTTITGGTFTSAGDNGIEIFDDSTNLTISGGTFTGAVSGLAINDNPTVKLSGGTFKATGTGADAGAIRAEGTFASLLASGYKYSSASTTTTGVYSVKETSVVTGKTTSTTTTDTVATTESEATINNPKTGDNIIIYISLLGLSLIALSATYTKKKKLN